MKKNNISNIQSYLLLVKRINLCLHVVCWISFICFLVWIIHAWIHKTPVETAWRALLSFATQCVMALLISICDETKRRFVEEIEELKQAEKGIS